MTLPLLGSVDLVPYAMGANPSKPAVCVLPDDTVLIAWQHLTTGAVTIRHYPRNLSTATAEVTIPGEEAEGDLALWLSGMAAFPNGDGATLAMYNRIFSVTTGPLAVTQTGTYADIRWSGHAASTVSLPGGATAAAADREVIVHRDGALSRLPSPGAIASLYGGDDGAVYVGVIGPSRVDLHQMDTVTGATSLVEVGPAQDLYFHGTGRPGVYAALDYATTLATYSPAGDRLGGADWPPDATTSQQVAYVGTAPHPTGGWVSAWWVLNWEGDATYVAAAVDTIDGVLTTVPLPLPISVGLAPPAWSQTPVVASGPRTAVIVLTGYQSKFYTGAPDDLFGITAWSVELDTDAPLHVGHQDGTWRKVGDESWADGIGRMLLGVPRSLSPSGWVMEVKPGDDASKARTMYLDMPGGAERVAPVRMIPWPG